jgi:hypothetical protein
METKINRCNKCILPNSCDLIPFDSDGTCILCKSAEAAKAQTEEKKFDEKELLDHIERIRRKGKGRPYDCVVGVSGGRDSTWLIHLLTQKHRLRCLAVYYRTPFTSNTVDQNIRRIVKQLGADFEEIQLSREYHRRIAREMILLWKKKQHRLIINMACAPCKLLNREIYRITARHNVPTIIYGTNIYEAVQIAAGVSQKQVLVGKSTQVFTLTNKLRRTFSLLWNGIKLLCTSPALWKYLFLGIKSSVMYISPHTFYLALRYRGIETFDYFYGGQWNESECEKALQELGWQRPPGCNTSWKADCCFAEIKNVLFQKTIGITYADAFFSNMVRAGVLSREDAIRRVQTEGQVSPQRLKEVKEILQLDEELFEGKL